MGYVTHAMARSLRTQSTRIVGVLVSDLRNPFYAELAAGIADRARTSSYTMMVIDDTGDETEEMRAAEAFVAARAVGVLVTPLGSQVVEYLRRQHTPVVEMDRQFAPDECDGVVIDNAGSARKLTELLLRLGHRRVSRFYDESEWTTGEQRISGYRAALVAAAAPDDSTTLVEAGWSMESARRVAVQAFSSAMIAFAFSYFRFRDRDMLFFSVLATMMLPGAVLFIPQFLIWDALGFNNTLYPLWANNLFGSAFYIFLLRQFFLTLPRELFEAALVDGASYPRMWWSIALPLIKPAMIVVFLLEVKVAWTDLVRPLIFLRDSELFTLARGLKAIIDNPSVGLEQRWELLAAGSVIVTLPMIVIFFIFQRHFVQGIATSGTGGR